MIQKQNTSWKKTNLNCEDCEYTTKGELYLVKHSAKLHDQFVECGLALPYSSSLELYRKENYGNNCGSVVVVYSASYINLFDKQIGLITVEGFTVFRKWE